MAAPHHCCAGSRCHRGDRRNASATQGGRHLTSECVVGDPPPSRGSGPQIHVGRFFDHRRARATWARMHRFSAVWAPVTPAEPAETPKGAGSSLLCVTLAALLFYGTAAPDLTRSALPTASGTTPQG
ncbi:hypothetical protein NDU88_004724 [Pleurodeles waltl]|uniref:Uncharacterized protein n=1 Tax=Pleurodeles waltl TaxID=8319 RepID=A0AAV7VKR1_PLEWA|nr:hypothetical protein NDU88_004724 [Pleurodeles waltl]